MKLIKQYTLLLFILCDSTLRMFAQGDDCNTALLLPNVVKYCSSLQQFTNVNSSASVLGVPSCWTGTITRDVWFKFIATGTDVQLSVSGGGASGSIKKPNLGLYSGTCSGTLLELACNSSSNTDITSLYKNSLTIGTTYLLRVSTSIVNEGTFTLCVTSFTPTVTPGADCDGAAKLCSKTGIIIGGLSGGGKSNTEMPAGSCFYDNSPAPPLESNSAWFQWTCEQAGTLTMDISPIDPTNDLDFILYELPGTSTNACGTKNTLRCSATSCVTGKVGLNMDETDISEPSNCDPPNTTSNGYLKYIDMTAGKTYVLMTNNFSAASGFTIDFGGSGTFTGPKSVITASNATICPGETITYKGNLSSGYDVLKWTFNAGNPAAASTIGPHIITYGSAGIYTTYLKATNGTCAGTAIDSFKITVRTPPVLNSSNAIVTPTSCTLPTGSIKQITGIGQPALMFEWFKFPATSISPAASGPDLTDIPAGLYYLIVTDGNGCKDTSSTFEIQNAAPPTPGVLNNISYCEKEIIQPLTATGTGGTFTWFGTAALADTLHVGPVYTPVTIVTDTLYLTETLNGCTSKANPIIVKIATMALPPYTEGFEGIVFPPAGWTSNNMLNDSVFWKQNKKTGGFGNSTSCMVFDNYEQDAKGKRDEISSTAFDLSVVSSPLLSFDVAYVREDAAHADSLAVFVSKDCGNNYIQVYLKGGKELATVQNDQAEPKFVPTTAQWKKEFIDLSPYRGQSHVIIVFQNRGYHGQPVYVDNITVTGTTDMNDVNLPGELLISPNPTCGGFGLNLTDAVTGDVSITIQNVLGQVIKKELVKNETGSIHYYFNFEDQESGMYVISVIYKNKHIVRKLIKQ